MKKKLILIFFYLGSVYLSFAQTSEGKKLTQQEFFDIILKYHPVAKQADINIEKAKADVIIAKGGFDPLITTNIAKKTFDGTEYYDHLQPELRIPTWYGIELVAGAEYLSGNRINPEETQGRTSYAGAVIPLVQNLFIDKRRATLQTAKVFRNLSEVEKRSVLNNLLLEAAVVYWNWAYQSAVYSVYRDAVTVNKKRLRLVRIAHEMGDRPALDTTEALTQLQNFQLLQNDAFLALQNAALDMTLYLWDENNEPVALPVEAVPANEWISENISAFSIPLIDDLLIRIRTNHPDLLQYPLKLEAFTIDRKLKFQQLLPKLDFKYNQLGKGYNILNAKSGALFNNNFQFGVGFAIPLRLSEGRGEFRKAKLKIAETKLEQGLKIREIENKVKSYFNELNNLVNQSVLAEKIYQNFRILQKGEELKFANGESSLFLVNSRENKTLDALQKLLKIKTEFYKTKAAMTWASGQLLN
ncbi:MAG TPA: TolC family protein [Chitinophagaceae bacterium]|nr:TolC family protein [Chitinophagaceae bacterium]